MCSMPPAGRGRTILTTCKHLPDYVAGSADANSVITVKYAGLTITTTNGKSQRQVETRNALDEVILTAWGGCSRARTPTHSS